MKPYFQDDAVTIYHGDCREIIPALGRFHVLLTDPPYGLGNANTEKNDYASYSDAPQETAQLVRAVLQLNQWDRAAITPGQNLMFSYPEPDAIGAFYYPAATGSCSWGFVCWQPIFFYGKDPVLQDGKGRRANSFASTEQAEKNGHPCPKPLGQWTWLLNRVSRNNETVLDPFGGSGTTGRAAKDLGRKAVLIEREERYCEIAAKRMEQQVLPLEVAA